MLGWLVALAIAVISVGAVAQTPSLDEKRCILTAAQRLPAIPGLTISGSRVSGLPDHMKQKSAAGAVSVLVEIDVKAAAQDATLLFVCSTAPGKPFFAEPVGISR